MLRRHYTPEINRMEQRGEGQEVSFLREERDQAVDGLRKEFRRWWD